MYEKITNYLDLFRKIEAGTAAESGEVKAFENDFMQSGRMDPDGIVLMGNRGWASRSAIKADTPSMTAEEVCACISAFVMQESFCQGILLDLIKQGVLVPLLERLKTLEG